VVDFHEGYNLEDKAEFQVWIADEQNDVQILSYEAKDKRIFIYNRSNWRRPEGDDMSKHAATEPYAWLFTGGDFGQGVSEKNSEAASKWIVQTGDPITHVELHIRGSTDMTKDEPNEIEKELWGIWYSTKDYNYYSGMVHALSST
jgi:hypothetical protein